MEKNPYAQPRVGDGLLQHEHVASLSLMCVMTQSYHSLQHDMVDSLKRKTGWLFLCFTISSIDPIIGINRLRNLYRTDSKSRIPTATSEVIQQLSDQKQNRSKEVPL